MNPTSEQMTEKCTRALVKKGLSLDFADDLEQIFRTAQSLCLLFKINVQMSKREERESCFDSYGVMV